MTKTLHNISLFFITLISFNSVAQQKEIAETNLGSSGLTFAAIMESVSSEITITITGPNDRWFGVGFGATMANADVLIRTTGRAGALHALEPTDYVLTQTGTNGVNKDVLLNSWDVLVDDELVIGTRTIVASRQLNTGDAQDMALAFSDNNLNVIFAKGASADMQLAYHGNGASGNRGTQTLAWTTVDVTPPVALMFTPADNTTNAPVAGNLSVMFSEPIVANIGSVEIRLLSTNAVVETIGILTPQAIIAGNQLIVNPASDFLTSTAYYINIPSGTVKDISSNGNVYTGISDNSTWNFTTVSSSDVTPPVLSAAPFSPADNAVAVPLNSALTITLNEAIALSTGAISLINTLTSAVVQTFTTGTATISGSTLTLTPTSSLMSNTVYHVTIANNAITDIAGNNFVGIANATTWNFTTIDNVAPTLATVPFSPLDNATNVPVNSPLTVQFNENITLLSGLINIINTSTSAVFQVFDMSSTSISGNTLSLVLATPLASATAYHITMANNAVADLAGNNFAGFTNATTWNFTTTATVDNMAPTLAVTNALTPADNAVNVGANPTVSIKFSENVALQTGPITLIKTGTATVVQVFNTSTATVVGNTINLVLTSPLLASTGYHITIANNAVADLAGNSFAGIANATTWNFATGTFANIEDQNSPLTYAFENDKLTISNQGNDVNSVKLINLAGQVVFESQDVNTSLIVETSNFTNQMLLIVVDANGKTWTKKIVL